MIVIICFLYVACLISDACNQEPNNHSWHHFISLPPTTPSKSPWNSVPYYSNYLFPTWRLKIGEFRLCLVDSFGLSFVYSDALDSSGCKLMWVVLSEMTRMTGLVLRSTSPEPEGWRLTLCWDYSFICLVSATFTLSILSTKQVFYSLSPHLKHLSAHSSWLIATSANLRSYITCL